MTRTIVLQSANPAATGSWLGRCLQSVQDWCQAQGHSYRFLDDALFDRVPDPLRDTLRHRPQMLSDLARLQWIKAVLDEAVWDQVCWLDADVVMTPKAQLPKLPEERFLLGREFWVQPKPGGGITARMNVHNAFIAGGPDNDFLAFYAFAAERVLTALDGGAPLQLVGPKMLTALHNMITLPVSDWIAMASPLVLKDLAQGGGPALSLMQAKTPGTVMGYNLCGSLIGGNHDGVDLDEALIHEVIARVLRVD